MPDAALIGRRLELAWLSDAADAARAGRGALVLVCGEAGVGKTRLVSSALRDPLRGAAQPIGTPAYGPVAAALRAGLRRHPGALDGLGPLREHLALVLPELGPPAATSDRPTVFEAIRRGLAAFAPAVVALDDLQWSDGATLELLAALAPALPELPLLIVGAYRSDEVGRGHPLRRLRADLRRAHVLRELPLAPLGASDTARLIAQVTGEEPSPELARALYERTHGVPFFVEELAGGAGPIPETIRDAVLQRTASLSAAARAAADTAAVAGTGFPLELALDELLELGLIRETEPGRAAFRHGLVRDALYADIASARRRTLHAEAAERLSAEGAPSAAIAAHLLAAGEHTRARQAFVAAAAELAAIHAHRDSAAAAAQALELWPEHERPLLLLDRYAESCELAGDLADATRALGAAARERTGAELAGTLRRLARLHELQGDRERARATRVDAATVFAAAGLSAEAAVERLLLAGYAHSAGRHSEAVELASAARDAGRVDLRARALGVEGVARAKRGEFHAGVERIQAGLSLALEHDLTAEAAELYQRLATAHESMADYGTARAALSTAVGLCAAVGAGGQEHTCLSCLAYVLRELGDWDEAIELCRELGAGHARADAALVADGMLGSLLGFRGDARAAQPLLERAAATATRLDVVSIGVDSAAALGWISAYAGDMAAAAARFRAVLERWERSEDRHYAVWGLRCAVWVFASSGDLARARAATGALSAIAASTGHKDALAAFAHALGELALREGDADAAAEKLTRALALHDDLDMPFERAQIALRAGVALAAAGDRDAAVARLDEAHRLARRLQARPLAGAVADELIRLGEPLEARVGRRAAAAHESGGLSRRELEVMQLVSAGRTNREIADQFFLSPRTVDMHVRNILLKLSCRTRTEAATRAAELGLITP